MHQNNARSSHVCHMQHIIIVMEYITNRASKHYTSVMTNYMILYTMPSYTYTLYSGRSRGGGREAGGGGGGAGGGGAPPPPFRILYDLAYIKP